MSRRQIIQCDRCGSEAHEDEVDRDTCGRVYAATLSGLDRVGAAERPADLCVGCLHDLARFMAGAAVGSIRKEERRA